MNKAILDRFLSELSQSSAETRRVRRFFAERFLQFAPDDFTQWNKGLVFAFEKQLRDEGYAPLTIRTWHGVIKRVFDAARAFHEQERTRAISGVDPNNPSAVAEILKAISLPGPEWDLGKRSMPQAESSDITRPRLSLDEIGQMIATARSDSLELPQVCYLALDSIYALRREELCRVRREHIDFDGRTIFMDTCKGGEKRQQWLPDEIIPYLKKYEFNLDYSPFMMSRMFKQILFKSGVQDQDGMGWHSFRRTLDTEIRDSLASDPSLNRDAQLITKIFFRWRLSSSSEMTDRYYTADPLLADRIALDHHPVVALWA